MAIQLVQAGLPYDIVMDMPSDEFMAAYVCVFESGDGFREPQRFDWEAGKWSKIE